MVALGAPPIELVDPLLGNDRSTIDIDRLNPEFQEIERNYRKKYEDAPKVNVAWEPIKGLNGKPSSQMLALSAPAHIIFYDGARGPGKTITQLMRFAMRVGMGYGRFWRGVIFDREHDNLQDMVQQSLREFPKIFPDAKFKHSKGDYKWVFATGEELLFRHVKNHEDYDGFHGHEYTYIGWNEITKYADDVLYKKFFSVNRSSFDPVKDTPKIQRGNRIVYATPDGKPLPPIPLETFVTTNPNGRGHTWVKEEFVDPKPPGEILERETVMFNPLLDEDVKVIRKQVRIFGNLFENPFISNEYRAEIYTLCENNPNLKAAWLYGDWSVNAGGMFDDLWDDRVHVIERFMIPDNWIVDRSHDWGSSKPFSTGWWAEANGETVELLNGQLWAPPRGTLFRIAEDYGCEKVGGNTGLKIGTKAVADRIKKIERALKSELWVRGAIRPGPADNSIRKVDNVDSDTVETGFADHGILWEESDKNKNSRIVGCQLMRDRLRASIVGEGPGIYFFRNCHSSIKTIPNLPRDEDDPDDVDTEAIDHAWDETRYRILKSSNRYAKKLSSNWGQG